MSFDAHVLKLLIASPGETGPERDAMEQTFLDWNNARAEREQIVLVPWRWERHAVPELGGAAQAIIDRQAVDACDLVYAAFNARLGTATDDAVSGTAHEILRAHAAGKPVHVWFSTRGYPDEITPAELKRLKDFKKELQAQSLLGGYGSVEDLQAQVRNAIELDLNRMNFGTIQIRSRDAEQARRVMSYRMSVSILGAGTWKVTTRNHSAAPVTGFDVDVAAMDAQGNEVREGVRRSREVFSNESVFASVIGDAMSGTLGPLMGSANARMAGRAMAPRIRDEFRDVGAAHMTDGFPSGLAPGEHAVALYVLPPSTTPLVRMMFTDETGRRWVRTNDEEPRPLDR
jgi:hypothetical protein